MVAAFCPLASSVYIYLKKNSSLRSFVKEHTDNGKTTEPAGFKQAFRDMSTYNKKPSCIANLLIYFTRRGLARMCFCFTVIATLVSWTNIPCNRFFFNRIWLLCIKLDPKERFKSICLATINWCRWRGCDRLKKKKKIKINIQNPIIEVSTWKYRNSAIYIKLWAFTVDIGSQDTKGARANGGKNSAEDNILEFLNLNFSRKVHTLTRARERGFPCSEIRLANQITIIYNTGSITKKDLSIESL